MNNGDVIEMRPGDIFYIRPATTAGWSARSPMSRSISSGPSIVPTRIESAREARAFLIAGTRL